MTNAQYTSYGFLKDANMIAAIAETAADSETADPIRICAFRGQAVELALKSFLLAKGMTAAELKKIGHNLGELLHEAELRGIRTLIGSNPINEGIIRLLNVDYVRKRFDYRETGATYLVPDESLIRQVIERLLRGINYYLNRHPELAPPART